MAEQEQDTESILNLNEKNSGQNESQRRENVKEAAAERIKQYYYQLKNGCGNEFCTNASCASSGKVGPISSDDAAALALNMLSTNAKLCAVEIKCDPSISHKNVSNIESSLSSHSMQDYCKLDEVFTLEILRGVVCECEGKESYAPLRIYLRKVFSDKEILMDSFKLKSKAVDKESINGFVQFIKSRSDVKSKEEIRASEYDLDKDVDSSDTKQANDKEMFDLDKHIIVGNKQSNLCHKFTPINTIEVDVDAVREVYQCLSDCPKEGYSSSFVDTQLQLVKNSLILHWRVAPQLFRKMPGIVHVFVILLENPSLISEEYVSTLLGDLCFAMSKLSIEQQVSLVNYLLIHWNLPRINSFIESLRIVITQRLLQNRFTNDFTINDDEIITATAQVMQIFYYVSICGGELDSPLLAELSSDKTSWNDESTKTSQWNPLGKALGIHPLDSRKAIVPLEEFYAGFLSDSLEMDRDFALYKAENHERFSFLNYPFILNPPTKSLGLYFDNRVRMYSERRLSMYQMMIEGQPVNPYLVLRIRRDHIIDDALVELELISTENPSDLKKQLVIEFENEQGVDEGGVSKEFFQLIIEQLFNPDYAMFVLNSETENFWFNPTCFESDAQFTLIGILLGLAIYNNIILDLNFPSVLYKKLLGKPGSFNDLKDLHKTLYNSLVDLLNYEEEDMEEVFMQTFCIGYKDIFGTSLQHDLIPDGSNIPVNQANKSQFVRLYAEFLLNLSIERQFNSFEKGFAMVTGDSPLRRLFRTDELELLICGSKNYDFAGLKKSTEYDNGYSSTTPIIKWFWELVDELETEDKKKLLQFTTGSARVPMGGLAKLKLVITRHGSDTDRLPTAHTCFNVLLLPEYSTKEKLKERLLKAIKYAQGFGML